MRTIKFRGKRLDNGEWVYGFLTCYTDKVSVIQHWNEKGHLTGYGTNPELVGQWTGLVDRYGKEIFEGDICKFVILPEEEKVKQAKALLYVIQWKNACFGFKPLFPDLVHADDKEWCPFWDDESGEMWHERYFEIISNIHDNPELMEV